LYQAVSDENGDYKLGVLPGTLTSLNAQKDGYNVVAPSFPYVQIAVFNTNGQKVRSLLSGFLRPGEHQIEWDGRDDAGNKVSAGVYFYTLKSGQVYKMMKMILAQ